MNNHEAMRMLISAYLDDVATDQERLDVEKHLGVCLECKKYYIELKSLKVVMSKYGEEQLSPDSEQKIKNDFLGGKAKREAVMKKKILISAGSVALVMVLVFTFAMQTTFKRGISGRMKESAEKIAGGEGKQYLFNGIYGSRDDFNADEITFSNNFGVKSDAGTGTRNFAVAEGSLKQVSHVSAMAETPVMPQEYSDVPVVIVEPYLPQSGNGEKVIYSATAHIRVKDAQAAYDRAAQITRENKGFIGSTHFAQSSDGKVLAVMSLRIPREKFESVLNALRALGDVKGINSSNIDVSQQYQEISQQLSNVKIIYDKMVDSLKDKKTDIEKAQRMESALTPYLQRIEMLRRQLANYDNQIAMSTIRVTFEESSLQTFLKHDFEDIHEQAVQKAAAALKSLALLVPAFIAFVIALVCALAAWNALRNNFLKK